MKMNVSVSIVFPACLFFATGITSQTTPPGSISGILQGSDGSPIRQGVIGASLASSASKARPRRTSATAEVLQDGTFRIPGLEIGTYQICVQAPNTIWLDPCQWGTGPVVVSLNIARPSANLPIQVEKGGLLTIRVIDPDQLLTLHEGKTPGAHLLLGVRTDASNFRTATVASNDQNGRNYRLLIPLNRQIKLSVASSFFQLADADGKALPPSGSLLTIQVKPEDSATTLLLRVTGTRGPS